MKQLLIPSIILITQLLITGSILSAEVASSVANVSKRSDFQNARIRFERDQVGHVAFIGGSITEMNGYRPMVTKYLTDKFPKTQFKFTAAGISSTCSTAGAFRLENDVLSHGLVDLFFIEFAVNDDQDAMHPLENSLKGMEGIIRHSLLHSPKANLVVTYFVNEGMLEKLRRGETPISIAAHEQVAKHYGVTTIQLAQEVADRFDAGTLTWKQYGGVHPAPYGNAIPAKMIEQTLNDAWREPLAQNATATDATLPKPIDENSYINGSYLPNANITLGAGWQREVPDWKSLKGSIRARHANRKMMICNKPGSELSFTFRGNAFGVECVAGPDAGTLLFSVDGEDWKEFNLSHRFSKGLHYPRTVVLVGELETKKHSVRLKLSDKDSDYDLNPAVRILNIVVNSTDE